MMPPMQTGHGYPAPPPVSGFAPGVGAPLPPASPRIGMGDWVAGMERVRVRNKDAYYERCRQELERTIQDLQENLDDEFNLTVDDLAQSVHERLFTAQCMLQHAVHGIERVYRADVDNITTQFHDDDLAIRRDMMAEVQSRRRRFEDEKALDITMIDFDAPARTGSGGGHGGGRGRNGRTHLKRGLHALDDDHAGGAGSNSNGMGERGGGAGNGPGGAGHGHGRGRKHLRTNAAASMVFKLADDELVHDMALIHTALARRPRPAASNGVPPSARPGSAASMAGTAGTGPAKGRARKN
ncbi:hypothetical protein AMAG_04980 [Allomyces macrogynus ATCC 38327]|uniref:Uncharacterized protein n=1 Tax=Allomyces macrogynus (strain ATCC 38327) TaxID=578462 RepID=A0A0L0S6W1_ALLM3|nr:hypothetical protein AMAG_04980 [Allomyces macrogynus ATCC 38327]|eukprot:KNE58165.1 hypothetical protein AMAG_04980 [Allomyces macrogynus ATCC 38327]